MGYTCTSSEEWGTEKASTRCTDLYNNSINGIVNNNLKSNIVNKSLLNSHKNSSFTQENIKTSK